MRIRWNKNWFLMAALVTMGSVVAAQAQQLPRSATIGTNTPGTVFYALAGGLAKVATEAGPVQTTIQPYTGTSTFLPLLNNGELEFGVVNGVERGGGPPRAADCRGRQQKPSPPPPYCPPGVAGELV